MTHTGPAAGARQPPTSPAADVRDAVEYARVTQAYNGHTPSKNRGVSAS